ncbi:hypothetical protein K443DRAFT_307498 [Laccaria amethystina LaAM-08-1]|uniref:Uncharacterized protein n=1 Tax=Laccaria amethystina LaAM-08-1 TaxID=1095629 RepID=A0A0C9YD06_9AGAR|nr:hypothetical protein K443DRAFT_307498 [Laccaria amethystina LaAM-08-1]
MGFKQIQKWFERNWGLVVGWGFIFVVSEIHMLDYNVHLVQRYNNDFYQIQDHQSKLLDESAPLTLAGQALPFLSYLITNLSSSCPSSEDGHELDMMILGLAPSSKPGTIGGNDANCILVPVLTKDGSGKPDSERAQRVYKALAEEKWGCD